jgi:hypothetical protein
MWTYSNGALTAKGYWRPGSTARSGSWVLVDQATGNVQGVVRAGEFSRRFRPVDVFADVPGLPGYLGTVTAPDGTALVDLVLDRNPFMLANGPRPAARPHALIVPRRHRDGWSSATAAELAARHTAMTLVAAWYRSMDGGHVVFCANDSAPNLDYLRDAQAASRTLAASGPEAAITKNPRQDVQHAHLHAFYAEHGRTENRESSALRGIASWPRVTGRSAPPWAVTPCRWNGTARASLPAWPLRRSPGVVITAPTSWAWTAPCGLCRPWDHPRTRSTGAWPGLMASGRSPTRHWAGLSTWCGLAWPITGGSKRRNGPQLTSRPVSRPSWPSTD